MQDSTMCTRKNIIGFDEDDLTCPICFEMMRKTIYQCKEGHLICKDCYTKIKSQETRSSENDCKTRCPTCKIDFDSVPIRCLWLEKFYPFMVFSCKNVEHGCTFKGNDIERKNHMKTCRHNKIVCPKHGCNYVGSPKEYFTHWIKKHATCFEGQLTSGLQEGKMFTSISEKILKNEANSNKVIADTLVYHDESIVVFRMTLLFSCKNTSISITPWFLTKHTDPEEYYVTEKVTFWKTNGKSTFRMFVAEDVERFDGRFCAPTSCDSLFIIDKDVKSVDIAYFLQKKEEGRATDIMLRDDLKQNPSKRLKASVH